ncbi:DUF4328 domain-containing protein [Nonomuraea lactucae]|uniref:DUF4328 domain-containing protein n=1 Tax=Nonomuraea lactucae TaxID=2249762 RepID=UPI0013B38F77|nr:DUF4328 domain-containing protein [Nonomuraea lactucae]
MANVALGGLALYCLVGLAVVVTDLFQLAIINRMISDPGSVSEAEIETSDALVSAVDTADTTAWVVAATTFLIWLFRARANAESLAPDRHRHGKPWLILSWIVPIIAFWYPKQIVDDIWAASHRIVPPRRSPLVFAWWTAWLIGYLLTNVVRGMFREADDPEGAAVAAMFDMTYIAVMLATAALVAAVILRITSAQEAGQSAPPGLPVAAGEGPRV